MEQFRNSYAQNGTVLHKEEEKKEEKKRTTERDGCDQAGRGEKGESEDGL